MKNPVVVILFYFFFFFVSRPDWMSAGNRRKLQLEVEAVPKSIGNDWP